MACVTAGLVFYCLGDPVFGFLFGNGAVLSNIGRKGPTRLVWRGSAMEWILLSIIPLGTFVAIWLIASGVILQPSTAPHPPHEPLSPALAAVIWLTMLAMMIGFYRREMRAIQAGSDLA